MLKNAKRLYEFYLSKDMKERAEDIAKNRPEVKGKNVLDKVKENKKQKK